MIRMIISKKGYQNKKLLCYARVMVLSLLAITFVLQTPMAVTPISASTNGTYVFKPVSSLEEITQRIDEMRPIFKGYRWGNTDPNKRKTKKQLKQAVLDGYTDMSTSYSMEERRAALGLQKISGNQDVSSNKFDATQCFGFAKFMCYVLFGQEVKCNNKTGENENGYECFQGKNLDGFVLRPGDLIRNFQGAYSWHAAVVKEVTEDGRVHIVEANVGNSSYGVVIGKDKKGNDIYGNGCWINWGDKTGYRNSIGKNDRWHNNDFLVKTVIKGSGGYVMRYNLPENSNNSTVNNSNIYTNLPDGEYNILTSKGLALDIQDFGTQDKSNVQIYESNNTDNQIFIFTKQKDGAYIISPKHAPGKVLDVSGGVVENGDNIWIYGTNGTDAQKFFLLANDDGSFLIASALDANFVLDVDGMNDGTNNANIHIWEKHGQHSQRFNIVKAQNSNIGNDNGGSVTPTITPIPTSVPSNNPISIDVTKTPVAITKGKPFGLRGTISADTKITEIYGAIIDIDGNFIQTTLDNPSTNSVEIKPLNLNQKLLFDKLDVGYYTLFIEVSDGTNIRDYTQSFKVGNPEERCYGYAKIEDGYYRIKTTGGKVFDIYDASTDYEANVQIYDDGGADNQIFKFAAQQDGSYMINPKHALNMALDISGGYVDNGSNLQIWAINGSLAQKFYLFDNGNGTFTIASAKNSTYVLDVQDRQEDSNFANIQIWEKTGDSNQQFYIERVG